MARKTRITRLAAQRLGPIGPPELLRRLRHPGLLLRLGICLVGVALTVIAARGWRPPFPYRFGYRPARDIRVMTRFERVNELETQRAKEGAAENVPLVFANDPRPLRSLPATLENQLSEVATAERLEKLSPALRRAFGFETTPSSTAAVTTPQGPEPQAARPEGSSAAEGSAAGAASAEQKFEAFRKAVASPEMRKTLGQAVDQALEGLQKTGLLEERSSIKGPADVIAVYNAAGTSRSTTQVPVSEVLLLVQADPVGPLAVQLRRRVGDAATATAGPVFLWVADRLRGIRRTLRYDHEATQAARQAAADAQKPVLEVHTPGESGVLVESGASISESQLELLRLEHAQHVADLSVAEKARRVAAVAGLVVVLFLMCGFHIVRNEPEIAQSLRRLVALLGLSIATVAASGALAVEPAYAEMVPLVMSVMVLAIAYSMEFGLLMAFALALLVTEVTGGDLGRFIVLVGTTSTAVLSVGKVRTRTRLISAGLYAGLAYLALSCGTNSLANQDVTYSLRDGLRGLSWSLAAGFIISGLLPLVERRFGLLTDMSLLELGDVAHPLLQELVRRAPGTYNHSIAVATLAERAAERIGANGLLVRVGAYFHDIGKMLNPHYFVENQGDQINRHEHLAPAMSTLIIIGHVKDGADLAREHHLPQPIIDFIEQHHGTTLVDYFYQGALRHASELGRVEESAFRYPGPKPQTQESGILMLADCVESATRTLSEPTPARIESLVHELAMKRLLDGQFDESGLDLQEIRAIEESLVKSLTALYHARIKYPEQRTA